MVRRGIELTTLGSAVQRITTRPCPPIMSNESTDFYLNGKRTFYFVLFFINWIFEFFLKKMSHIYQYRVRQLNSRLFFYDCSLYPQSLLLYFISNYPEIAHRIGKQECRQVFWFPDIATDFF